VTNLDGVEDISWIHRCLLEREGHRHSAIPTSDPDTWKELDGRSIDLPDFDNEQLREMSSGSFHGKMNNRLRQSTVRSEFGNKSRRYFSGAAALLAKKSFPTSRTRSTLRKISSNACL
jgi:hypothetical protein